MALQLIDVGTVADDGTGDDIREAFIKLNGNLEVDYTNSSNGTGAQALTGAVNGVNTTYTVYQGSYVAGTVKGFWNGQRLPLSDVIETTPGSGVIDLGFAPATGEVMFDFKKVLT